MRLIPAGAPSHLSADVAAGQLRRVRTRDPSPDHLAGLAVELVAGVVQFVGRACLGGSGYGLWVTVKGADGLDAGPVPAALMAFALQVWLARWVRRVSTAVVPTAAAPRVTPPVVLMQYIAYMLIG